MIPPPPQKKRISVELVRTSFFPFMYIMLIKGTYGKAYKRYTRKTL